MTLILNQSDWDELCEQAPKPHCGNLVLNDFEEVMGVPERLGRGYIRNIELSPEMGLHLADREYHQDFMVKAPIHNHPIQIGIHLSGFIYFDTVHPNLGGTCSYFSGSGISPAYIEKYRAGERLIDVSIEIEPEWLESFLIDEQYDPENLKCLFKGEDWKVSFYPTVTHKMRSLVQQMWNAPYRGAAKRMYLQAKVLELLAMHLENIIDYSNQAPSSRLKPETIARLHYAKEILTSQFANPPSSSELARQVGVSDRTLQRGFRALFNTTVVGYLIQQRLEQAEKLLRQGNLKVTEVAHLVGYEHLGQFAAAFKRQFGITPRQCLAGEKTVFRSKADFR